MKGRRKGRKGKEGVSTPSPHRPNIRIYPISKEKGGKTEPQEDQRRRARTHALIMLKGSEGGKEGGKGEGISTPANAAKDPRFVIKRGEGQKFFLTSVSSSRLRPGQAGRGRGGREGGSGGRKGLYRKVLALRRASRLMPRL